MLEQRDCIRDVREWLMAMALSRGESQRTAEDVPLRILRRMSEWVLCESQSAVYTARIGNTGNRFIFSHSQWQYIGFARSLFRRFPQIRRLAHKCRSLPPRILTRSPPQSSPTSSPSPAPSPTPKSSRTATTPTAASTLALSNTTTCAQPNKPSTRSTAGKYSTPRSASIGRTRIRARARPLVGCRARRGKIRRIISMFLSGTCRPR